MKKIFVLVCSFLFLALGSRAQSPSAFPYAKPIPNDPTTGTTQFTLTKINSSGNAVIMATTDTNGYSGVCVSNCGTSGTAWIAFAGLVPLIVDGTATADHYLTISSTTGGDGHDSGATTYPTGAVIGRVQTGATSGNRATVDLFPAEIVSAFPSGTTKQVLVAPNTFIDFPEVLLIPSANCSASNPGAAWSIGSGGTVTCRAGTNNKGGYVSITDTSSSFAQFVLAIPEDWDSSSLPYIRFQVASADTTSGHTIIPEIQVSCSNGNGSTTDDVTFNATHSASTITTNTTANQYWSSSSVQMNSTDMTGCVAGALMTILVGRATDTATSAFFYGANVTFPRLITVQAN
jgi:hypothetical protein